MNFDVFWTKLDELLSSERNFITINQQKPFEALRSIDGVVVTPKSSGEKRLIKKEEFTKIYRLSKSLPESEVFKPNSYQKDSRNSSYIVTFFDKIMNS